MERIITIDLTEKYDVVEKYNEDKAAEEILKYVIRQAMLVEKYEKLKVIINNQTELRGKSIDILKAGLRDEYKKSVKERKNNNFKQIIFFLLGVLFIFFSTLIKENTIWKEILLISGWVPIWEMVEMELFPDMEGRQKRKIIKRLLKAEMIEE